MAALRPDGSCGADLLCSLSRSQRRLWDKPMAVFEGWTFAAARGASRRTLIQIADASKIGPGLLEQIEHARDIARYRRQRDEGAVQVRSTEMVNRLAEFVGHGDGPGGLAAQGYRGNRRATATGFSEGSAGASGTVPAFGSGRAGYLSGQPV